jgi:hypothetical protein
MTPRGSSPLPSADPREGREGLKLMARTEHDRAARRRGELTCDRGSIRLSSSIDARRRLNTGARMAPGPKHIHTIRATGATPT